MSVPGAKEVPKKNFLEIACSYCAGKNFVKRGLRKKSKEIVQLYFCRDCQRTFTPGSSKGKHYPLSVILDAISLYDLGYSLEEAARLASKILERNSRPIPEVSSPSGSQGQPGTKGATSDGTDLQSAGNIGSGMTNNFILKNMVALALAIPHLIAQAHSSRFGSSEQCLLTLDKVMLDCNRMVVYLEQTRDICETGVELDQFEQQIKNYFFIRQKVLNLQRVWKKYIEINKEQQKQ